MTKNHGSIGKQFQCYLCRMNFITITKLRVHMKCHEKDHKCKICKAALTRNELNTHLCGDEAFISCEYCDDEFTATLKLLEHLQKSHVRRKFYQCEKCPKFFVMIGLRKYHMKTHAQDEAELVCNVCCKIFDSTRQLKRHMNSHDTQNCK